MNIIVAILILGIIVIVHELGHFLLAKKNGITVTEFSVGMGPRLASFVKNGTRYSLKLFPIGGSCMMLGEDEAVEDEGAFYKKGVWARFSVIFAGAFFNFIFAFILALIFIGDVGVDKPFITEVGKASPALEANLKQGDRITKINDTPIHFTNDIDFYYYFHSVSEAPIKVQYVRDGKKQTTTINPKVVEKYYLGCNYDAQDTEAKLTVVDPNYPLGKAGVKIGDVIVNINGTAIASGKNMAKYFEQNPLSKKPVDITYQRDGKETKVTINPQYVKNYNIGWALNYNRAQVSAPQVVEYSFYELKNNIVNTLKSVFYLVTGKISTKEIAGPVGIVNFVGQVVDSSKAEGIRITIMNLISFSILISANLGVMNLLPLPALDGGRLIFLLIEAIRRKPVPKEKEAMVHMVGMVLLMLLMVFVMFNDIQNIIR
jgi:RIP metalloprotease RseP